MNKKTVTYKINQSLWNKFRIVFPVEVITKELCYNTIDEHRIRLRDLLFSLEEIGLSNRQISDYLNERNIKSPRGGTYTSKLVWVTLKKWRERGTRLKERHIRIGKISIEVDDH